MIIDKMTVNKMITQNDCKQNDCRRNYVIKIVENFQVKSTNLKQRGNSFSCLSS